MQALSQLLGRIRLTEFMAYEVLALLRVHLTLFAKHKHLDHSISDSPKTHTHTLTVDAQVGSMGRNTAII